MKKEAPGSGTVCLRVVGPNALLNNLLIHYLKKETGYLCYTVPPEDLDKAGAPPDPNIATCIILLDHRAAGSSDRWDDVMSGLCGDCARCLCVLFNVKRGADIEKEAITAGLRGVFHENVVPEQLCEGIRQIVGGEVWFSRRLLYEQATRKYPSAAIPAGNPVLLVPLTGREMEILRLLATGASNQELSDRLSVSLFTVKTHLYNIYKKIGVPNRLKAVFWITRQGHGLEAPTAHVSPPPQGGRNLLLEHGDGRSSPRRNRITPE